MVTSEIVTSLFNAAVILQERVRSRNIPASMCLLITFSVSFQILFAQPGTIISSLDLLVWDNEKRKIIVDQLDISQAEAEQFRRLYERYENSRRLLCKERLKTLDLYDACSPEKIKAITRKLLSNDLAFEQLYTDYQKSFWKIIGPRRTVQFLIMEKYFQTVLNSHVDSLALPSYPAAGKTKK